MTIAIPVWAFLGAGIVLAVLGVFLSFVIEGTVLRDAPDVHKLKCGVLGLLLMGFVSIFYAMYLYSR